MARNFRNSILLSVALVLANACSSNSLVTPHVASVADVSNAKPIKVTEGFGFTGELEYIPGERIGETIQRAGGFSSAIFRSDVVKVIPERVDPTGVLCLADQEKTRPGDVLIAVRKGAIGRTFSCSLPAGADTISFGRGFVFSGVYEFEVGRTLSETVFLAGGLYEDGYIQDAVWGQRLGNQTLKVLCLNSTGEVDAGLFLRGIKNDELDEGFDCSHPDGAG